MEWFPVNVVGIFTSGGKVYPRHFLWGDGHKYSIERVLDVRPDFSARAGGRGLRYTVQIGGRERHLWLEDMTWYLEGAVRQESGA